MSGLWKILNPARTVNIKDKDYGSLDYWDGEDEFSLHQAVCLWLDYKPEDGGIVQKFPSDLKMALEYFLSKAKEKELTVWPCHEYERDMYRELFKNRSYPFNPDERADMSDGAIERAFKKRGLFSHLRYRVDTLPIFDDPKDDKVDPELAEAERYYHGFAVWRKDLIRLAEKINHKPLFLSPPELRQGKTLREIWPTIPTLSGPVKNEGKVSQPLPKVVSKRKTAGKKKKKLKSVSKPKTPSKPKPKLKSKPKPKSKPLLSIYQKRQAAPNKDKGKIGTLRQIVERTASTEVSHSSDFRSMTVHGKGYEFTEKQARIVKHLFSQHPHSISDKALIEMFGLGNRVRDSFKINRAWGVLIVQGGTRGTRRLNLDPKP